MRSIVGNDARGKCVCGNAAPSLDEMIPFVDILKVPSPIHAGFRGMQQGELSTK